VLAVAGGAWALFGRDTKKSPTSAIGPKIVSSASANPVFGPVAAKPTKPTTAPKTTPKTTTATPTSLGPVAAPAKPAATVAPKPVPTKAAVRTPVATAAPSKSPAKAPAAAAPVATGSQQGGTVAKKAYTFRVARGDTLWNLAKQALNDTGRATSNANVARYVTRLYEHNSGVVGSDPNLILPGQVIVWPSGL
jgi:nucleoid-associated protein YgaU